MSDTNPGAAWAIAGERLHAMGRDLIAALPSIVVALGVLIAFAIVGLGLRTLVRRVSQRRRRHRNLGIVLGRLVHGAALVFGILIAAVIAFPRFTPASLLQFLGIGSVAIGFAFRDVLQNYLAGILLLLTEPFRIGDQIVFGEHEGTVENVETRATLVRTYDGRRVVIPNAELFTNSVTVNTAFPHRRIEYDVGIGYGDDIARAKRLILEALARSDAVLRDPPPEVLAYELGPSAVSLRVRWWVEPPKIRDVLESRDTVIETVRRELQEHGVDLPFPTQQVLFHDQTEATDGDRSRQREGWPAGGGEVPDPRGIAVVLHESGDAPRARSRRRGAHETR
jgi:small-conductance mechanosensitive channel